MLLLSRYGSDGNRQRNSLTPHWTQPFISLCLAFAMPLFPVTEEEVSALPLHRLLPSVFCTCVSVRVQKMFKICLANQKVINDKSQFKTVLNYAVLMNRIFCCLLCENDFVACWSSNQDCPHSVVYQHQGLLLFCLCKEKCAA